VGRVASGGSFFSPPVLHFCPISITPPVVPTRLHLKNLEKYEGARPGNCGRKYSFKYRGALERIVGSY
jgi:hypothetical protein